MMNISEELKQALNRASTYLSEGAKWHSRVANMLRTMPNKRGYARIHDDQAALDAEKLIRLSKLSQDFLGYLPTVDMNFVARAESYTLSSFEDFKTHFDVWLSREDTFNETANSVIDFVRPVSISLYTEFCSIAKDLQEEYFRAKLIRDSLEDCGWDRVHCSIVSKWLHEQAEESPGKLNYNIG